MMGRLHRGEASLDAIADHQQVARISETHGTGQKCRTCAEQITRTFCGQVARNNRTIPS
jgi:hypothetical protein